MELRRQIRTSSCVSGRERWRIRPPLFCQLMCARLQTQSREPPASVWPVSGKHPARTATGAEKQEQLSQGCLLSTQSDFHAMSHHMYRETHRQKNK